MAKPGKKKQTKKKAARKKSPRKKAPAKKKRHTAGSRARKNRAEALKQLLRALQRNGGKRTPRLIRSIIADCATLEKTSTRIAINTATLIEAVKVLQKRLKGQAAVERAVRKLYAEQP
jgi:hypothetical protein